jgi:arsenite methyltransferase
MTSDGPIKENVKEAYTLLAENSCCGTPETSKLANRGYISEELKGLPESVLTMSDGCGNPTALGAIRDGDTILDLGSGGGIDVFLAARKVGRAGRVIGLDMTPKMVESSRANLAKLNLENVEFKLGEIEHIPLASDSVDVVMSNCVICLSPEKEQVFREMFRVLRPGGRLAIADEVALRPFTEEDRADPEKWCSCITGAVTEAEYSKTLQEVGFEQVYVRRLHRPMERNAGVFSAFISGAKPSSRNRVSLGSKFSHSELFQNRARRKATLRGELCPLAAG